MQKIITFFLFEKKSWQDFKLSMAGASQPQVFQS